MPAVQESKTAVVPFGIEADHPRNSDLLIQCIPGLRLRSAISASRTARNAKTGESYVPPDQSAFLGHFPPIPGMQLHIQPTKLTYMVVDPLYDDEQLCEKIQAVLRRISSFRSTSKFRGVETQNGTLDVHRMKTLVREMTWLVGAGEARVVKGTLPDAVAVEEMAGNFLLNPGSRVHNTQPVYEKDWDQWMENLTRSGG